jgi:hypothetical protein
MMQDKYFQELAKGILKDPLNKDIRIHYGELLMAFDFEQEALDMYNYHLEKEAAISWMRNTAEHHNVTFEDLLRAGHLALGGDVFTQIGSESLRDSFYTNTSLAKYWEAWSKITGYPNPGMIDLDYYDQPQYIRPFSCSC